MANIEELEIERLEAKFDIKKPSIPLRSVYNSILARKKNANYCCDYFNRYCQKQRIQTALYKAQEPDLIGHGFDYNIFNRPLFRCVFHSLVSNNISRIDNLEKVMLELFPNELDKYVDDVKSFSFKKLCDDFPDERIALVVQAIFDDHQSFTKIQNLRDQMAHLTIDNILSNDPMLDEEDDLFVNADFTLSGRRESVADFAKSLNELLFRIEEQIFNCLMTHGKDCLNDVQNRQ